MPWINYVPIKRAVAMVGAVNNARTEQEHREAKLRLEGYKQRCDEIGQVWPGTALDDHFATADDRPMCCGEYLDWQARGGSE